MAIHTASKASRAYWPRLGAFDFGEETAIARRSQSRLAALGYTMQRALFGVDSWDGLFRDPILPGNHRFCPRSKSVSFCEKNIDRPREPNGLCFEPFCNVHEYLGDGNDVAVAKAIRGNQVTVKLECVTVDNPRA